MPLPDRASGQADRLYNGLFVLTKLAPPDYINSLTRGRRTQVAREQSAKLRLSGSNPLAASIFFKSPAVVALQLFFAALTPVFPMISYQSASTRDPSPHKSTSYRYVASSMFAVSGRSSFESSVDGLPPARIRISDSDTALSALIPFTGLMEAYQGAF